MWNKTFKGCSNEPPFEHPEWYNRYDCIIFFVLTNQYGHPAKETIERLLAVCSKIFSTMNDGEVMEALAHTIDAKDEYTKGHSVRVAKYSRMIAEKMGLSAENCENIYYMGLLHDIGKIGVPNEIINKPTKLSDEEYSIIKLHPVIGYDILIEIKSKPELLLLPIAMMQ